MKITKLSSQVKNPDRINVFLDNKYIFSLDISQIVDLQLKVGNIYTEEEINQLRREGEFSKYYVKALNYSLIRPRSIQEVKDYLYKQTRTKAYLLKGERQQKPGMPPELTQRIVDKLIKKKHLDDEIFARYWVENRNLKKGVSQKILRQELIKKGVLGEIVESTLISSERSEEDELKKVIKKRQHRYSDRNKFIKYLISKGYSYSLVQETLSELNEDGAS